MTAVLEDWRTAPVSEKLRATLGFLETLTLEPAALSPSHVEPLRAAGVIDQAVAEAVYVCFLFSILTRLADAFDIEVPSPAKARRIGRILYYFGYSSASLRG